MRSAWLQSAVERTKLLDQVTYQRPGDLLPQAVPTTSLDKANNRPFPQAVVMPSTDLMEVPALFPRISARHGMSRLQSIEAPIPMSVQLPAMKKEADAPAPSSNTFKIIGITALVVLGVFLLVQYNR